LIGVGRARRGELLSSAQFIHTFAVNHAFGLVRSWLSPAAGTELHEDDLNRFRRFEFQYPEIGMALESLRQMDVETSAKELVSLVKTLGRGQLTQGQLVQIQVVADRLGWRL
jgi:hypothetical protein